MARQTKADSVLARWVNDTHRRELMRQMRYHADWFTNLSYMADHQWVQYNEDYGIVQEIPRTKAWQVRLVMNNLPRIVSAIVAQLTEDNPCPQPIPRTSDESARLLARKVRYYLDEIHDEYKIGIQDELIPWALICSDGWVRVEWDPDGGGVRTVEMPETPEEDAKEAAEGEDRDPEAEREAAAKEVLQVIAPDVAAEIAAEDVQAEHERRKTEQVRTGRIRLTFPSTFNVFMDPAATRVEDAKWIMETSYVNRQRVEETYKVELRSDVTDTAAPQYTPRIMAGIMQRWGKWISGMITGTAGENYVVGSGMNNSDEFNDMVILKEVWIRPSREYPKGRYIVVCNDKVLKKVDNDEYLYDGELPYVRFRGDPQPGSTHGTAIVSRLRPCQDALNRSLSQYNEVINLYGRPQWLIPTSAKVDLNHVNARPSGIILYTSNAATQAKPERLSAPYTGQFWGEFINMILNQMDEIAGLKEASRGINPSGVRSAVALKELKDTDSMGRAPLRKRFEDCMTRVFRLILRFSKLHVAEDRTVRLPGMGGASSVLELTPAEMQQIEDVRVSYAPGLPKSPQARIEAISNIIQGLLVIPDPALQQVYLRTLEFGEFEALLDGDETSERQRINDENQRLIKGEDIQAQPFERQMMHAEGHARFMRSELARALFDANPQIQQRLQAHLDEHINWLTIPGAQQGMASDQGQGPSQATMPGATLNSAPPAPPTPGLPGEMGAGAGMPGEPPMGLGTPSAMMPGL